MNLYLDGKCPKMFSEYIVGDPFTPLVKPRGYGYLDDLQFGVGVSGGVDAVLHVMSCLIKGRGDDVGLLMLLGDFKNAFKLQGDPLGPLLFSLVLHDLICKIRNSFILSLHAWYHDDGTIIGDTLVVGKVLELIMEDGPRCSLHLNVDKIKVFLLKQDLISGLEGVFPPNIARSLHGAKLLSGPASVDFNFSSELVIKIVAKSIVLMDTTAKINDPQCELLLLLAYVERIVTASGPRFGDWQWRLATLPFSFRGLDVYSKGDVLNYAFLASRL
ncbi:hypothetical protein Tco_0025335 [Tanacetum coccineum]